MGEGYANAASILISNCTDLQNIGNPKYRNLYGQAEPLSGNYVLNQDIECKDSKNWNNGVGFIPIGAVGIGTSMPVFNGAVDGNGHSINNLYTNFSNVGIGTTGPMSLGTELPLGLFSRASGASIQNLQIKNANVIGGIASYVSILVGNIINSFVQNITVDGSLKSGQYGVSGGLAAYSANTFISRTSANVNIQGGNYETGGLVGLVQGGFIRQSSSTGVINAHGVTGGLVGGVNGGDLKLISDYSTVAINYSCAHPLNKGYVQGVGGLLGDSYSSTVTIFTSYAATPIKVIGSACDPYQTGGLIGHGLGKTTIYQSPWDSQVTGQTKSYGVNPYPLTTLQMKTAGYFNAWINNLTTYLDPPYFEYDVWQIADQQYPILTWQEQPSIDAWNVFSAASLANQFKNEMTPLNKVNWPNIVNGAFGVNWVDMMVLSRPTVWNDLPVRDNTPLGYPYANTLNWTNLTDFSNANINWADLVVLSKSGINWSTVNPLHTIGTNWDNWESLTEAGIKWQDFSTLSRVGVNWDNISLIDKAGLNWSYWVVLTQIGINWNNIASISNQGLNWNNIGVIPDAPNANNLATLSHENINWQVISILSRQNVNWDNPAVLKYFPSKNDILTLKKLGNTSQGSSSGAFKKVSVNISGNSTISIKNLNAPVGLLNCSNPSNPENVCTIEFPLGDFVFLSANSAGRVASFTWGNSLCNDSNLTCGFVVTKDTTFNVVARKDT